jgi:hypothetical protein
MHSKLTLTSDDFQLFCVTAVKPSENAATRSLLSGISSWSLPWGSMKGSLWELLSYCCQRPLKASKILELPA